jgi:hypothetical protein
MKWCRFSLVMFLFLSIVMWAAGCANSNPSQPSTPSTPASEKNWETWLDDTVVIPGGNSFKLFGHTSGTVRTVKYSLESTCGVDAYWLKTPHDCDLLLTGQGDFSCYPLLSAKSALQYSSPEGDVPGESGLVIENKEKTDATVKILIQIKK